MSGPRVPALPRVLPLGEEAWIVTLGDRVELSVHKRVVAFTRTVEEAALDGVREVVPGYTTVTVCFDALTTDAEALRAELERLASIRKPAAPDPELQGRTHLLPVRYDGPDLLEVASRTGLSPEDVVRRHVAREYRVYLLGFAPGFAYLGDLDPALELPRRPSPRTRVPPGSVAIAGLQTAVYPLPTPGGWHLIGSTGVELFDAGRDPPALLAVGDRVRFVPVDID